MVHVEVNVKATAAIGMARINIILIMNNPLAFVPVARQRVVNLLKISWVMDSSSEAGGIP